MKLGLGLNSFGELCISVEARIRTPDGSERLQWTTHFESEAPFLHRVVSSTMSQHDMALILAEVIKVIAGANGERHCVDVEFDDMQFYELGLGTGECLAYGPDREMQQP